MKGVGKMMMRSAFATIVYSYDEEAEKRINKDKWENKRDRGKREMVKEAPLHRDRYRPPATFLRLFLPSPSSPVFPFLEYHRKSFIACN